LRKTLLPPAALAVVVVIAAVVAACGGTQSSSGASSSAAAADTGTNSTTAAHATTAGHTSTLTPRQKAVKFTECMRANGVSDFPDPDASGQFPSYGVSVTPAVWTKAVAACKSLQPPGTLSAKLTPAQESAALEFAHCVRANGVPDFPDPVNGQPLIDTTRIPSANKPGGMTILNAATHKCGHFIAEQMAGH
jgi:hypothetical protein